MKALALTLMATAYFIVSPCESQPLPDKLGDLQAEGDLGNLGDLDQEYLGAMPEELNDELPMPNKRFSPDSVKMALIRAFVKQMRSIRGRRMPVEARPQQKKRELVKAAEVLRP